MKTKVLALFLAALSATFSGLAQSKFTPEDDIYYTPGKSNSVIESKRKADNSTSTATSNSSTGNYTPETIPNTQSVNRERDVNDYNRRYSNGSGERNNDQSTTNEQYQSAYGGGYDTEYYVQEEDGYYLNGFNGTESDYQYAERIRRFHNPRFTVHISDPFYNDLFFLNSYDWNVYMDGSFAWVTPTWTNPWSWNYMWTPFNYSSIGWRSSLWGFGGGWGMNPWHGGGHWGGNWGWSNSYWGWNNCNWGWGGHHNHYPNWGWGGNHQNRPHGRQPSYGRLHGNSTNRPAVAPSNPTRLPATRPGGNTTTRPSGNNNNNRPAGNNRPAYNSGTTNGRPSGGAANSETTRPSGNNGSTTTTRPSGTNGSTNVTRPSGNSNSSEGSNRPSSGTRPNSSNSGATNSDSRPSSGSTNQSNSNSNSNLGSGSNTSRPSSFGGSGSSSGGGSSSGSSGSSGGSRGGRR